MANISARSAARPLHVAPPRRVRAVPLPSSTAGDEYGRRRRMADAPVDGHRGATAAELAKREPAAGDTPPGATGLRTVVARQARYSGAERELRITARRPAAARSSRTLEDAPETAPAVGRRTGSPRLERPERRQVSAVDSSELVARPAGFAIAVKHGLDRVIAAILLVALIPALLVLALAVRLNSPGPALYRQRRVTRGDHDFELLKFRSMYTTGGGEADYAARRFVESGLAPGGIEDRDRLTAVGRFLRRTSLDELPQLINVVRGEMSLVGPRPERSELVELFAREIRGYRDRHQVRAGITGLAQVRGLRGPTSLRARVDCDQDYVTNWSLWLDLKILVRTVFAMTATPERGDTEAPTQLCP
jgi:lipopolysaccharide/colanic/teichoic acid biosynthesis glycosyltransferase